MTWQPIETAPKDGTKVLIYGTQWLFDWQGDSDGPRIAVCSYDGEEGWDICHTTYYSTTCVNPTHWMPLPEFPKVPE